MARPLAVFTDSDPERVAQSLEAKLLGDAGVDLVGKRCTSEDQIIELAKGSFMMLNGMVPITRKVLENAPTVKGVIRYGVGFDNVDVKAATEQGVAVVYVPDYCMEEVYNHAMVF
ncbi:MAG: C-terminal binding protein, partial [Chloroflexi bacterium]|nr:C-terminal binding protein [Chloroflexota bacterium]